MTKTLFYKLEQTDSTHRYKNGTQGTALELILENPIIGYGFGDKIYIDKYNSVVPEKPDWVFKKSLGPHNIWLYIWFGVGISGLIAFSAVFCRCVFPYSRKSKVQSMNQKVILHL